MVSAHGYLRELIYTNVLPPGTVLSQVELANALGVSRTPLREALRMLQEEGLIEAEANRRCRIAKFCPEDLDSLYASRLLIEALGMRITLPQLRASDLAEMEVLLARMEPLEASEQISHSMEWREDHRAFHEKMLSKCTPMFLEQYRQLTDRCERYLTASIIGSKVKHVGRTGEHRGLLDLVTAGKFDAAVVANAQHRTRTAITFLAHAAIDFEPVAIRSALRLISADADARTGLSKAA